jgi:glycerol kinase
MQLQADITGSPGLRAQQQDTTALGAAMAAGQADGIDVYNLKVENRPHTPHVHHDTFLPTTTDDERNARYTKWRMAVERSLGWAVSKKSEAMTDEKYRLLASIPASLFVLSTFVLLTLSQTRR